MLFLLPKLCVIAAIHCHLCISEDTHTTHTCSILDALLLLLFKQAVICSVKNKKNKVFPTFIYSFYGDIPFFMYIEFLICIIFLLEELLLTYLIRQFYWPKILSIVASLRKYLFPSLLKDNFTEYRMLNWWFFFFNTLNISLHSLLVCLVSEVTSYVILYYF